MNNKLSLFFSTYFKEGLQAMAKNQFGNLGNAAERTRFYTKTGTYPQHAVGDDGHVRDFSNAAERTRHYTKTGDYVDYAKKNANPQKYGY
jgi:hypothetical protein